jgi:hypothetical protein
MQCVNEIDAKKVTIEKKKELLGKKAIEISSNIKFDIVGISYGVEKYKTKVLSYPVIVSLSNDESRKDVELDQFKMKYNLVD